MKQEIEGDPVQRQIAKLAMGNRVTQPVAPSEKGKHFSSSRLPTGCPVGMTSPVLLGWTHVSGQRSRQKPELYMPLEAREV